MSVLTKEILAELIAATATPRGKRETHVKHLQKIVKAVGALDDESWDTLSDGAADWYNDAVNAINDGQDIPGADNDPMEEPEQTKPTRGRNRKTETEEPTMKKTLVAIALAAVAKSDILTVTCGEDTFTGEVTKVSKSGRGAKATVKDFTLKTADGDEVFTAEDLIFDEGDKIEREEEVKEEAPAKTGRGRGRGAKKEEEAEEKPAGRGRGRGAKKEEKPAAPVETDIAFEDIAEGDALKLQVEDDSFEGTVSKVTKKGRGAKAKVVAIELTTADGVEAFEAEHIVVEEGDKIIKVVAGEAAEEKAPAKGRGSRSKKAPVESAASQVRKLICENLDADKKAIEDMMKEDGVDMKPSTFDVLYSEAHNLIAVLRDLDKLAD